MKNCICLSNFTNIRHQEVTHTCNWNINMAFHSYGIVFTVLSKTWLNCKPQWVMQISVGVGWIWASLKVSHPKYQREMSNTAPFFLTNLFILQWPQLEKEMATHSIILTWRIPGMGAWWAAIYGVAQSRTRLTWLSSSNDHNMHMIENWKNTPKWLYSKRFVPLWGN